MMGTGFTMPLQPLPHAMRGGGFIVFLAIAFSRGSQCTCPCHKGIQRNGWLSGNKIIGGVALSNQGAVNEFYDLNFYKGKTTEEVVAYDRYLLSTPSQLVYSIGAANSASLRSL